MAGTEDITELDLLAYADGRLDAGRERQVRAYLEARPELEEKLADFARQNEALHDCYDRYLSDPLPERIQGVLERDGAATKALRRRPMVRQAMAASVLMLATGVTGWWIGSLSDDDSTMQIFLEQAATFHSQAHADDLTAIAEGAGAQPLNWFSEKMSFELRVPDLTAEGYELVDNQRVSFGGRQGVVLRYASEDGQSIDVFLKTRWQESLPGYRTAHAGDVSLAYWLDGPLAVAVAANQGQEAELTGVADALREALAREVDERSPSLEPTVEEPATAQEAGVVPNQNLVDPNSLQPILRPDSAAGNASGQM